VEALFEDPEAVLNLDTFRTSGRRLRAGSDVDVTDVSTVTVVTTVTAMTAVTRHELQHVTWDSFYRSPQIGTERLIKHPRQILISRISVRETHSRTSP
jgi:hypothetical protein